MTSHVDPALLQMFAAEVETHMASLNDGVLALEQNPDQSQWFESLMRAAHSIKGAARLVGLQAAVEVAHAIEDCFVAAREGRLGMTSRLVDALLEGVDLLGRAAQYDAPLEQRVTEAEITSIVQRIMQASTANADEARPSPLPAATHRASEVATQLAPRGRLDASWANAAHAEVASLLQRDQLVELDLQNATEIEPLALALLSLVAGETGARRFPLRLRNVPTKWIALLTAVGLAPALESTATRS